MSIRSKSTLAKSPGGIVDLSQIKEEDRKDVESIMADINGAYDRIRRAGKRYITLGDDTKERLRELTPPSMVSIWDRLEQVGVGLLHPQLVIAEGTGAKYLAKLPIDQQEHYLKNRFEIAIPGNDSLMVDVEEMSLDQRRQVFAVSGESIKVRSLSEQRAWLADQKKKHDIEEERRSKQTKINRPGLWEIKNRKAYIDPDKAESGLTAKEVERIRKDLKLS